MAQKSYFPSRRKIVPQKGYFPSDSDGHIKLEKRYFPSAPDGNEWPRKAIFRLDGK